MRSARSRASQPCSARSAPHCCLPSTNTLCAFAHARLAGRFPPVVCTAWAEARAPPPQKVVIGGAGRAAAAVRRLGSRDRAGDPGGVALFLIIVVGTPPHIMGGWRHRREEYARARDPADARDHASRTRSNTSYGACCGRVSCCRSRGNRPRALPGRRVRCSAGASWSARGGLRGAPNRVSRCDLPFDSLPGCIVRAAAVDQVAGTPRHEVAPHWMLASRTMPARQRRPRTPLRTARPTTRTRSLRGS